MFLQDVSKYVMIEYTFLRWNHGGPAMRGGVMGNCEPFLCPWWLKLEPMIVKKIAEQVTELCYMYYIGHLG